MTDVDPRAEFDRLMLESAIEATKRVKEFLGAPVGEAHLREQAKVGAFTVNNYVRYRATKAQEAMVRLRVEERRLDVDRWNGADKKRLAE